MCEAKHCQRCSGCSLGFKGELVMEEKADKSGRSLLSTVILIASLNATVTIGAINTGMFTVLLPHIGEDLHMSRGLLLWPALVYSLTCGCTLLLSGAIADVVGNRSINLVGTLFQSCFILGVALAQSATQLIIFRALQGIGISMCFPTSVSILSAAFPRGKIRNVAFGCLGFGTPLGFAIGILVGGGMQTTKLGWRPPLYFCAAVPFTVFFVNLWCLPYEKRREGNVWLKLRRDIDWIGVLISSTSMALLSYSLALMSGDISSFREPAKILLLIIAILTIPLFLIWMHAQERRGRPALIPNSLWKSSTFSAICAMVLLTWATLQGMEWFMSLYYQQIKHLSPIETAARYMPNIVAGGVLNIVTGFLIHRVPVNYYVVIISAACSLAPLLMATTKVNWPFWYTEFWVMLLLPWSVDVNFTVANLVITDIFPKDMQALAGGVYQAISQLGISIGIGVLAVISNTITDRSSIPDKDSPEALLLGFRPVFWTCFAMMALSTLIGAWGLRGRRRVGENDEKSEETKRKSFHGRADLKVQQKSIKRKSLPPKSQIPLYAKSAQPPPQAQQVPKHQPLTLSRGASQVKDSYSSDLKPSSPPKQTGLRRYPSRPSATLPTNSVAERNISPISAPAAPFAAAATSPRYPPSFKLTTPHQNESIPDPDTPPPLFPRKSSHQYNRSQQKYHRPNTPPLLTKPRPSRSQKPDKPLPSLPSMLREIPILTPHYPLPQSEQRPQEQHEQPWPRGFSDDKGNTEARLGLDGPISLDQLLGLYIRGRLDEQGIRRGSFDDRVERFREWDVQQGRERERGREGWRDV